MTDNNGPWLDRDGAIAYTKISKKRFLEFVASGGITCYPIPTSDGPEIGIGRPRIDFRFHKDDLDKFILQFRKTND